VNIRVQTNCLNINWDYVTEKMIQANMGNRPAEIRKMAFENSSSVVFIFHSDLLIGFGRAISDGAYEAAIYDVVVLPEFQGRGFGKMILEHLIDTLPTCNFILFAVPGKETFYEKLNFRKMKTGMALFRRAILMKEKGYTD
jgi:GNAT superfamily N-acetyltransferase